MSVELATVLRSAPKKWWTTRDPAIDLTLGTAAYNYRDKLIGILLSGANRDGGLGMKLIKEKAALPLCKTQPNVWLMPCPRSFGSHYYWLCAQGWPNCWILTELNNHYRWWMATNIMNGLSKFSKILVMRFALSLLVSIFNYLASIRFKIQRQCAVHGSGWTRFTKLYSGLGLTAILAPLSPSMPRWKTSAQ